MVSLSNHEVAGPVPAALVLRQARDEGLTVLFDAEKDMAWYRNFYHCTDCDTRWEDEWSCCCDDECPECGSRNWSPYESEDLTEIILHSDNK